MAHGRSQGHHWGKDRQRRRGGGVAIYVHADTDVVARQVLNSDNNNDYELLWVSVHSTKYDVIIGAIYHPPKPKYRTSDLLDYIEGCVEKLATSSPDSTIILAGDLNGLPEQDLVIKTGLTSIIKEPTRGNNCLDRIFVSELCYTDVKVVNSAIKSDH